MPDDLGAVVPEPHVPVRIKSQVTGRQPRDIPCPQTVRFGRAVARHDPCARLLCPSAMMLLLFGLQDPVDDRLRRQVLALLHQRRHDLARRTAGKQVKGRPCYLKGSILQVPSIQLGIRGNFVVFDILRLVDRCPEWSRKSGPSDRLSTNSFRTVARPPRNDRPAIPVHMV